MDNSKKNRIAEVTITDLSKDGYGKARYGREDGKVDEMEVPFSIPGDHVEAAILKRRKGVVQSQLLKVIHPSSDRIPARCIHFGSCGGCRWQQMPYESQLKLKETWILEYLSPYINENTQIFPILPCDIPWNYRNKAEFTFSTDKAMNYYLGFILANSRGKVFNLEKCHLIPDWMNQVVELVRDWWKASELDAYHAMRDTGSLRTLTLREGKRTDNKMIILTVSGNANFALKNEQLKSFVSLFVPKFISDEKDHQLSIFLRIQQIAKGQPTNFYEMQLYGPDHIHEIMTYPNLNERELFFNFQISPMAFFQPNTSQAEKLYRKVVEIVKLTPNAVVYDLYCGTCTLGLFLSEHVKEVHGIELSPESVIDAKENIKRNNIQNVKIHQGDVGKILPALLESSDRPDIIVVDPPRAGLDPKALANILAIKAPQIVYVSCNPITQAQNMDLLIQAGYTIHTIQPVDQFPHTVHVENIVFLTHSTYS